MTPKSSAAQPIASSTLTFNCPSCDRLLSVPQELSGITSPCPSCGQSISAPAAEPPSAETFDQFQNRPNISHLPPISFRRKRIMPDSLVDQEHLERKEMMKSLAIISLFILTFALCLGVAWFLKDWIAK